MKRKRERKRRKRKKRRKRICCQGRALLLLSEDFRGIHECQNQKWKNVGKSNCIWEHCSKVFNMLLERGFHGDVSFVPPSLDSSLNTSLDIYTTFRKNYLIRSVTYMWHINKGENTLIKQTRMALSPTKHLEYYQNRCSCKCVTVAHSFPSFFLYIVALVFKHSKMVSFCMYYSITYFRYSNIHHS